MTILIDRLRKYPPQNNPYPDEEWSHLVSDASLEELHDFAASLGLKRKWFQHSHYDCTKNKYAKAIQLGACPVTSAELVKRMVKP